MKRSARHSTPQVPTRASSTRKVVTGVNVKAVTSSPAETYGITNRIVEETSCEKPPRGGKAVNRVAPVRGNSESRLKILKMKL